METFLLKLYKAAAGFSARSEPFSVGFFLGLLGLILVWIIFSEPRKNAMLSTLIGILIWRAAFGVFRFR